MTFQTIACLALQLLLIPQTSALHLAFWDDNVTATNTFTSLTFTLSDVEQIKEAAALGLTNLWNTELYFINYTSDGYELRADWRQQWAQVKPDVDALFQSKAVDGFFLGDELVWNGLNISSLHLYSNTLRQQYPTATTWYNEASDPVVNGKDFYGHIHNYTVPLSLNWLSVDTYHMSGPDNTFVSGHVKPFYEQYLFPKLANNQSAMLVPGSFSSDYNPSCNHSCYDDMCALDATNFYSWAKSDARIAGIAPWHWGDCDGCDKFKDEIGTARTVKTKATWTQIGHEIKGNTQVPPVVAFN